MLKEGADRSAEQIEKTKQEQIRKQQKGEGHWHEELASQGESNIAADKEKVHDHDSHMRKLQEETKKKGEKGELN
jgi:predicted secreted protein